MTAAEKYAHRDDAFLAHLALYVMGLYPVLSELFCEGKTPGNAIRKLENAGWVVSHQRALPGRLSYVQLTQAGCAKLGVPKEHARPLGTSAIDLCIAVAFFCCLLASRRYKLDRSELRRLYGNETPPANVAHVVAEDFGYPAVLRVFHAVGDIARIPNSIRDIVAEIKSSGTIGQWAASGDYGLLVLCPSAKVKSAVEAAVERQRLESGVRILIDIGPTARTLAEALRNRGAE